MGDLQKFQSASAGVSGARQAMARLSASMKTRNLADQPRLAQIAAAEWESVLSPISASALHRAVSRFIAGTAGEKTGFAPNVTELACEARRIAADDIEIERRRELFTRPKEISAPERSPEEVARRRALADEARKAIAAARLPTIADAIRPRRTPEPQRERPAPDAPAADHEAHARALAALPLPRLSPHAAEIVRRQMRSAG